MPSGAGGRLCRLRIRGVTRLPRPGFIQKCYTSLVVKRFRTAVAAVLVLLWTGTPLAACLLPGHALTAEERECCRKMAGACEGQSSSHSCCKSMVRPAQAVMTAKAAAKVKPPAAAFFIMHADFTLVLTTTDASRRRLSPIHSPPGNDEPLLSILRI